MIAQHTSAGCLLASTVVQTTHQQGRQMTIWVPVTASAALGLSMAEAAGATNLVALRDRSISSHHLIPPSDGRRLELSAHCRRLQRYPLSEDPIHDRQQQVAPHGCLLRSPYTVRSLLILVLLSVGRLLRVEQVELLAGFRS